MHVAFEMVFFLFKMWSEINRDMDRTDVKLTFSSDASQTKQFKY